jgi:hydroxyacylglutathione hydrolase
MVLIPGRRPTLVDTGFGSDLAGTEALLRAAGVPPERLALIVHTHYHSDHTGGTHGLQARYGTPVAAHAVEAALVNARDPQTGCAAWLDQPLEPYRVDRALADGEPVEAGDGALIVLHTPGHTRGHLALYAPEAGALIAGDALHHGDVPWINPFGEGADALERTLTTLDRLAALPLRWACSGHGPPIPDPAAAIAHAQRRYTGWLTAPEKAAWHACKRIFAFALMIRDGLPEAAVTPYLLACPWFADYSRAVFALAPADFVAPLLAEMLRSGAAEWRGGRLVARGPHRVPPPGWATAPTGVRAWPPI